MDYEPGQISLCLEDSNWEAHTVTQQLETSHCRCETDIHRQTALHWVYQLLFTAQSIWPWQQPLPVHPLYKLISTQSPYYIILFWRPPMRCETMVAERAQRAATEAKTCK